MLQYFETILHSVESLWSSQQDEVYFMGGGIRTLVKTVRIDNFLRLTCKININSYFASFYQQALLLFLKEVEKTCILTQKWVYHLLLMTSYLVTIVTGHHQTFLKMRARDERTGTENFRCWCSMSREKNQKNFRGGQPPPLPCTSEG